MDFERYDVFLMGPRSDVMISLLDRVVDVFTYSESAGVEV